MKLTMMDSDTGRTVLRAAPTESSETAPFPYELIIDARIDNRPADRLWVAAALCFGGSLNGTWVGDYSVSAPVLAAVRNFLPPLVEINIQNVTPSTQWYAGGTSVLLAMDDSPQSLGAGAIGEDLGTALTVEVRRLGDWAGRLFGIRHYILSSNAFLHARRDGSTSSLGAFVAVGVLLATDLNIDKIVVPVEDGTDIEELRRVQLLCRSVGIDVVSASEEHAMQADESEGW